MDATQTPEPGKRAPAPGDLRLVQAFVNTVDIESAEEIFDKPASLQAWLVEQELIDPTSPVGDTDLRLLVQVREALRALALANHSGEPDARAVDTLNRVAESSRLAVRFQGEGRARLEPKLPGVDGAIGKLLGIVYTAMAQGTWSRMKACRRHTCQWIFYDRSKNRSSAWCSMNVCGNREKAKAYRRRLRDKER